MFIGHIPVGYITSRLLYQRFAKAAPTQKLFVLWGMLGAVMPDIDLVWFYLVDHRQHHHHQYFTHYPIVWLLLLLASLVWMKFKPASGTLALVFSFGGLGHMLLDTIVGDIWWLAPFYDQSFSFFEVHPGFHPWWLNFILHWSFALELLLVAGAFCLFRKSKHP